MHRTLPPAAAPFSSRTLISGLKAVVRGYDAIEAFKRSVRDHYGRKHCILVSSGAAALTLILNAIKTKNTSRRRVVIPAYTCYSVAAAIKRAGLELHPVDIDPESLDFNKSALSTAVSNHSKEILAVIPTHLFGLASDVIHLRNILDEEEIVIVEDAAQALGAHGPQGLLGGIGDVGFFSLGRGKAFSTMGGGAILTDDDRLAYSLSSSAAQCDTADPVYLVQLIMMTLFVHIFSRPELFWLPKSLPFLRLGETIYDPGFCMRKLSTFQAGLATGWQKRLEVLRSQRQSIAQEWQNLSLNLGIRTPNVLPDQLPNLIRFPIYISQPLKLSELLLKSQEQGLGIMPGYPTAIARIPALEEELSAFNCDTAQQVARQLVTLPTHGWVTSADRRRIAECVTSAFD